MFFIKLKEFMPFTEFLMLCIFVNEKFHMHRLDKLSITDLRVAIFKSRVSKVSLCIIFYICDCSPRAYRGTGSSAVFPRHCLIFFVLDRRALCIRQAIECQ